MKSVIGIILVAMVSGCATPYQNEGFKGGYSEVALGDNVYQVAFSGNAYVSASKVADFALLRSAELTLEKGFRYFVIVDNAHRETTGVIRTPMTTYASTYGNTTTYNTYGGVGSSYSKPSNTNTIVCFKDKPDGFAYDARQVTTSLRQKHGLARH